MGSEAIYDIEVLVGEDHTKDTYTYRNRSLTTVRSIENAIAKNRVFGLLDDELKLTFFKTDDIHMIRFLFVDEVSNGRV